MVYGIGKRMQNTTMCHTMTVRGGRGDGVWDRKENAKHYNVSHHDKRR
jgi:hypothetical protein